MYQNPAFRITDSDEADRSLSDLIDAAKRRSDYESIREALYQFMKLGSQWGFSTHEIAVILRGYLAVQPCALTYIDDLEISELFNFIGNLKKTNYWNDEETIKFQTMIMTTSSMEGILETFKRHPMYVRIVAAGTAMENDVSEPLQYSYRVSSGNDNNDSSVWIPHNSGTAKSANDIITSIQDFKRKHSIPISTEYEDPNQLYPNIISDPEEIEIMDIQSDCKGITYVLGMEITSNVKFDLTGIDPTPAAFDLLRAFWVDTKCTLVLTIGEIDKPNAWIKTYHVKPCIWTNFSEKLMPFSQEHFCFQMKLQTSSKHPEKIGMRVMGTYLKRSLSKELNDKMSRKPTDPNKYGFRRNFTLRQ